MIEVTQTTSDTPVAVTSFWQSVENDISNTAIKPLICYKSQATKKEVCFLPTSGPFLFKKTNNVYLYL